MTDERLPIVAEVSRTWGDGHSGPTISQMFEEAIKVNVRRGYRLSSWKFTSVPCPPDEMSTAICETIVAVFDPDPNWSDK